MNSLAQTKVNSVPKPLLKPVPSGLLQRKCDCGTHTIAGGECRSCEREKSSIQLQRAAVNAEHVNEVPPIVHDVLHSPGQPLDASTRGFFEPRFGNNFSQISACSTNRHVARRKLIVGQRGDPYEVEADAIAARVDFAPTPMNGRGYDFSDVRIHTDARAAESARAVNAAAYTVGRNIVFGAGQFAPQTARGRQVLAHELTHVVQQQAGEVRGGETRLQRFGFGDVLEIGATIAGGPLLGAKVASLRPFFRDLKASIKESPKHFYEFFKDEVLEAIKEHWVRILLVTLGLIAAEEVVAVLAATPEPTMLTKVIAVILQIAILAILGYFAAVEVKGAVEEGIKWFATAKKANGDSNMITEASRAFVRMVWHIVMTVLAIAGVRARVKGFSVPGGTTAGTAAGEGAAGISRGDAEVIPISKHPGYVPKFKSPTSPNQPTGYYGGGGAAPKLEPIQAPVTETPPVSATAPVKVATPVKTTSVAKDPGVQVGPAVAAGVSAAASEEEGRKQHLVNAFGNTTKPRDPRRNIDITPDPQDYVGPTTPPTGASTFANVKFAPLTGHYHSVVKASVPMGGGLKIIADGVEVGGTHLPTHHTIYPAKRMLFQEFVGKFQDLEWKYAGKK